MKRLGIVELLEFFWQTEVSAVDAVDIDEPSCCVHPVWWKSGGNRRSLTQSTGKTRLRDTGPLQWKPGRHWQSVPEAGRVFGRCYRGSGARDPLE